MEIHLFQTSSIFELLCWSNGINTLINTLIKTLDNMEQLYFLTYFILHDSVNVVILTIY